MHASSSDERAESASRRRHTRAPRVPERGRVGGVRVPLPSDVPLRGRDVRLRGRRRARRDDRPRRDGIDLRLCRLGRERRRGRSSHDRAAADRDRARSPRRAVERVPARARRRGGPRAGAREQRRRPRRDGRRRDPPRRHDDAPAQAAHDRRRRRSARRAPAVGRGSRDRAHGARRGGRTCARSGGASRTRRRRIDDCQGFRTSAQQRKPVW